jgi:hypothetical protein
MQQTARSDGRKMGNFAVFADFDFAPAKGQAPRAREGAEGSGLSRRDFSIESSNTGDFQECQSGTLAISGVTEAQAEQRPVAVEDPQTPTADNIISVCISQAINV